MAASSGSSSSEETATMRPASISCWSQGKYSWALMPRIGGSRSSREL